MSTIYLSGPMSGYPDHNFKTFNAVTKWLRAMGHNVINPVELNPDVGVAWAECLKTDIIALMGCDVVATLPGWELSRGAVLEVHIAQALGYKCVPVHVFRGEA
jgi:hypothetical protein